MLKACFTGESGGARSFLLGAYNLQTAFVDRDIKEILVQGTPQLTEIKGQTVRLDLERCAGNRQGFETFLPEGWKVWIYCNSEEFISLFEGKDLSLISSATGGIINGVAQVARSRVEMGAIGHIMVL